MKENLSQINQFFNKEKSKRLNNVILFTYCTVSVRTNKVHVPAVGSLWLLFHLAWVIVEIYWWETVDVTSELWPVYLTNWGYAVLLLYLVMDFLISVYVRFIINTRVGLYIS